MQRVVIIGSSGSGKSTLARQLGELTGLPVHHLDRMHWRPGWVEIEQADFDQALAAVLKSDRWIIDGNYGRTMEMRLAACDTVIFLDLDRITCLRGALTRFLMYRGKTRPDMTPGCDERINWEFIQWIWGYPERERGKVLVRLKEAALTHRVITLRSRRAIRDFLRQLPHIGR